MAKCLRFAKIVFTGALWLALAAYARAEIICAGDIPPEGMVITATGTAPSCDGACRARKIQPVFGEVMKICADQPIPEGYVLDGLTNTPACKCLGSDQNAYIIKRKPRNVGYGYDETLIPSEQSPIYGTPFTQPGAGGYGQQPLPYPPPYSPQAPAAYGAPVPPGGAGQAPQAMGLAPGNNPPAPNSLPPGYYPPPGYYYSQPYDTEPMRIGE